VWCPVASALMHLCFECVAAASANASWFSSWASAALLTHSAMMQRLYRPQQPGAEVTHQRAAAAPAPYLVLSQVVAVPLNQTVHHKLQRHVHHVQRRLHDSLRPYCASSAAAPELLRRTSVSQRRLSAVRTRALRMHVLVQRINNGTNAYSSNACSLATCTAATASLHGINSSCDERAAIRFRYHQGDPPDWRTRHA
jgi:hypothetical protein